MQYSKTISCNTYCIGGSFLDGQTQGDGTSVGKCPNSLKCLSTGACNVCGLISGTHEGCVSTSTTPICDADSATTTIEDTAVAKEGICKGCTKSGPSLANRLSTPVPVAKY